MYKLLAKNIDDKLIELYSCDDIFAIDCITGEFTDRDELLDYLGNRLGKTLNDIFIKYETENRDKIISSIVYSKHIIPSQEEMVKLYGKFLEDDVSKINESYLRNVINNLSDNFDIETILRRKMVNYRTRRECYFHMIKEREIVMEKVNKDGPDYLRSIIDNIDTDNLSDQDIMIEKIKAGEIEPNYYDIDDYVSMKRIRR